MYSHNLFEGVNELLLALSILFDRFLLNSVRKFSTNFNNYEFGRNRISKSHSFLRDVLYFLYLFPHLSSDLDEIPYMRSAHAL